MVDCAPTRWTVDYPDIAAVGRGHAAKPMPAGSTARACSARGQQDPWHPCRDARRRRSRATPATQRRHVIALGATLISTGEAIEIVDTFLSTPMREARYIRRLLKIRRLEERF